MPFVHITEASVETLKQRFAIDQQFRRAAFMGAINFGEALIIAKQGMPGDEWLAVLAAVGIGEPEADQLVAMARMHQADPANGLKSFSDTMSITARRLVAAGEQAAAGSVN